MPTYRRSLAQSLQSRPSTPSKQSLGQSLGLGGTKKRTGVQTGITPARSLMMRSPGGMAEAQWQHIPPQVTGAPQAPSGSAVPSRLAPGAVPYQFSGSLGLGMTGNPPAQAQSQVADPNGNPISWADVPQVQLPYDAGPGPTHAPGTIGNPSRALVSFLNPGLRPKVPSQAELFVGPQQPAPRDAMEQLKAKFGGFNPNYQSQTINADEGGTPTGIRTVANSTQQKPAFQPRAGIIPGPFRTEVSLSPSGRMDQQGNPIQKATVQGNLPEDRLKALGVVGGDHTAMHARQRFNRKRMENKLLANRLGIDLETGDPATQGLGTEDYVSGLRAMSNDRADLNRQLQDRRIAQGAAQGNPMLAALQGQRQEQPAEQAPAQPEGPDDAARWRNQYNSVYGSLLGREGMTPQQADQEARRIADMMYPGAMGSGAGVATAEIPESARTALAGMTEEEGVRWLTQNQFGEDVIQAFRQERQESMTPAQRRESQTAIDRWRRESNADAAAATRSRGLQEDRSRERSGPFGSFTPPIGY